jgi:hypothetical protein
MMTTHHDALRPRTVDRHGHIPIRGAIAQCMGEYGLSRPTVLAGLRAGRLRVSSAGKIEPTPDDRTASPAPPANWRSGPEPCHGAFTRCRKKFGLGIRPLYDMVSRGEVVVDPATREYVPAPANDPAPAVQDRRAVILADVERYLDDLARVDRATAQEFAHALVNAVQRLLARSGRRA